MYSKKKQLTIEVDMKLFRIQYFRFSKKNEKFIFGLGLG
jgi:hypothetical protein